MVRLKDFSAEIKRLRKKAIATRKAYFAAVEKYDLYQRKTEIDEIKDMGIPGPPGIFRKEKSCIT